MLVKRKIGPHKFPLYLLQDLLCLCGYASSVDYYPLTFVRVQSRRCQVSSSFISVLMTGCYCPTKYLWSLGCQLSGCVDEAWEELGVETRNLYLSTQILFFLYKNWHLFIFVQEWKWRNDQKLILMKFLLTMWYYCPVEKLLNEKNTIHRYFLWGLSMK